MRGQATATAQVPDVPTVGYLPGLKRLPYDPAMSKKLLAEAGYANGFDITVAGPNDRYVNDEKICEAVAKYLAKVGLKVTLDVKPKSIFFRRTLRVTSIGFYLIGWFDGSYRSRPLCRKTAAYPWIKTRVWVLTTVAQILKYGYRPDDHRIFIYHRPGRA
jgi:ABC-type transport system substrate-binding protein